MHFIQMGSDTHPTILLIHGLSATAESCYGEVGRLLQKDWHILLCELDGHYAGSPAFSGIDDECRQIETFIRENKEGQIRGIVGLSLGGTIAVSLLGRGGIQAERCILDAAFCVDMGLLRGFYTCLFPLGVARIRDGRYVPGFVIDRLMGKGNRSVMQMLYPDITAATCRSACREIYAYHIPESLNRTDYAVEFWRGSNEYYPKKSAELLRAYLPDMTERVFPNMGHCQFLHEQPNSYAELVDAFMRE